MPRNLGLERYCKVLTYFSLCQPWLICCTPDLLLFTRIYRPIPSKSLRFVYRRETYSVCRACWDFRGRSARRKNLFPAALVKSRSLARLLATQSNTGKLVLLSLADTRVLSVSLSLRRHLDVLPCENIGNRLNLFRSNVSAVIQTTHNSQARHFHPTADGFWSGV